MSSAEGLFLGTSRFVVEGRLGAGGMGVVHRVRDLHRGEVIALKTMVRVQPDTLLRFKREFRALADISHPNVVQLYELFSDQDQWFFTMELIDGVDLLTWVAASLTIPPPKAPSLANGEVLPFVDPSVMDPAAFFDSLKTPRVPVFHEVDAPSAMPVAPEPPKRKFAIQDPSRLREALRQLAAGLSAIHAAGKLHRDVKPPNVMVTRTGRVVLLDFGVVADVAPGASGRSGIGSVAARMGGSRSSVDDQLAGTPAYMSPEQAALERATPASDWYAVGVILYEALTGRLPFDGLPLSVFLAKRQGPPPPPSAHVDGIPEDLERLAMDLLERDPRARPSGDEIRDRLAGVHRPVVTALSSAPTTGTRGSSVSSSPEQPFVGRREELAALRRAFDASTTGLSVVMLRGRSGMGKSALAARFLGELSAQPDVLVLTARCYEQEAVPFKAIDPIVDELCRWLTLLPESDVGAYLPFEVEALARVFPVLGGLGALAYAPPEGSDLDAVRPQELRRRAFAALRETFALISQSYRLVVHVDDLQWCDADSVQLLEAVFALPAPPFLFVCSYRSELAKEASSLADLRTAVDRLGSQCAVCDIEVSELSESEAQELARALVDSTDVDVARLLTAEANGNPLFLGELARWAKERPPVLSSGRGLSLDQVILDRVARLPEDARSLLETLSVARGPLEHAVAARAANIDPRKRRPALVLRGARLVVTRGLGDEDPIETAHDRVRETLVQNLGDERKRACHALIARTLADTAGSDPEAIFEHFRAAGDRENAKRWALPAARAAERALAFLRAADLYEAAIELWAAPLDELFRRHGDALAHAGRLSRAGDAYLAGAAQSARRERLELRRMAAESYLKSGRESRGIEVLRSVLEEVHLDYPASTEIAIASILWHEAAARVSPLRRRLRRAESVRAADLERIDAAFTASTGLALCDPYRAADFSARGLVLALEAGEPLRMCRALAIAASNTAARGEPGRARAEALVREAERVARQVDEPHALGFAEFAAGTVHYFVGEWRSARARLERAERYFRESSRAVAWELGTTLCWICNILILTGEFAEVARRVPSLVDEARIREDWFAQMHLVYPQCCVGLVANDVDAARNAASLIARPGDVLNAGHWGAFISACSVDRYCGDGRSAFSRVQTDWPALDRSPLMRSALVRTFSTYERGLSALASASEGYDRPRALRAASRWAKDLDREKVRFAPALGHLLRAGVAAAKRDSKDALRALDHALPLLDDADLGYLAACARHRKGELVGGSPGRELIQRSLTFFQAQGVESVDHCLGMSAPGFAS